MEKENLEFEEHEFDGIKELNNPMPNWLMIIFLVTIGFSMIYFVHYFSSDLWGENQENEYKTEVAEYAKIKEQLKKDNIASGIGMTLEQQIELGKSLYTEKACTACHGINGEGNDIGPNLTDQYWINGCSKEEVVAIITKGNPTKGMLAYESQLSESQIESLAIFILNNLMGSNPQNAKSNQGEICN